jgi:hypothetical protein
MVYRKGDMWHCCRNCTHWPERRGAFIERNSEASERTVVRMLPGYDAAGRLHPTVQQSTFVLSDLDYEGPLEC